MASARKQSAVGCNQWRNWWEGRGARRPSWQEKCKKWAPC